MEEISLTPEQKLFARGTRVFGCSFLQSLTMGAMLWHPDDLIEMMVFMGEHQDATPEQLYEVCLKIASKRPDPPDPYFEDALGD